VAVLSAQVEKCPANQYTITFDTAGGSYIAPITQGSGTAVTAPANPSKSGFVFAGWDIEILETMPAENITITAKWTVNTYTVKWVNYDGKELETDLAVPYGTKPSYDGATPVRAATSEYSYRFDGWSPSVDSITGDTTYTASNEGTKKEILEGCNYNVGDVIYVKSSKVQYCKSCGKLLNYYTATITGLRGVLEGTPVYWIKLHCCGYRTSVIESSIISKE